MVHSSKSIPAFASLIQPDKMPPNMPRPKRVTLEYGLDHSGDEAFYINLIYPDDVSNDAISWKRVEPLYNWVVNTMWDATDEQTLSYVYVRRESEVSK